MSNVKSKANQSACQNIQLTKFLSSASKGQDFLVLVAFVIKSVISCMSWCKVLSKSFILMQDFSKSVQKLGSYGGLNIFKMAVMDAVIFEAL